MIPKQKFRILTCLVSACTLLAALAARTAEPARGTEQPQDVAVIRVDSGLLRGIVDDETFRCLGVPYAAPPIGELRWAAPRPPEPWEGVRDAATLGEPAPQGSGLPPEGSTNEDCLHLNIIAPRKPRHDGPKAVMVWLHGGGFSGGTAKTYDPRRLVVEGDVIVVLVEFRLNIFGFFGYPGLEGSGTFGLQDQQEALRWVQRNITAFGGDPGNVTLFGESGGAIAACAHLTSPGAEGLFHRVILQSGAATTSWPRNSPNLWAHGSFWLPVKDIESAGVDLAVEMGCPEPKGSPEALRWLRDQPAATLLARSAKFGIGGYGGAVLPLNPSDAIKQGRFHAVPALSGFTRDEARALALGMMLIDGGKPMTDDKYRELLESTFGERRGDVEASYPRSAYESPALAWSAIYTDRMFAYPQLEATRMLARRAPAFAFEFADTSAPGFLPFVEGFPPGAMHSGELPFLFECENRPMDMTGKQIPLTEVQQQLAATMVRYWTQFAWTGDPNGAGTPTWPQFDADAATPRVQRLAPGPDGVSATEDVLPSHHYEFWKTFVD